MGTLESLVLPGLVVVILVMTFVSMRVDGRQRKAIAEKLRAEEASRQKDLGDNEPRLRRN